MPRLPLPGSDDNAWGDILNEFLLVEHNNDGTLKASGSLAAKADDASVVHTSGSETIAGTKTFNASPIVPVPTLGGHATTKTYVDTTVAAGAPDATTTSKGIVQLAGDLAGTAAAPTVPDLANKQPLDSDLTAIAALTPADDDLLQRKSGAWINRTPAQVKSDLAITKSDVGLGNVDNTSDATKNSAAVTLTNKTIALGSNTISGTTAQFNTALTDGDFATLAGTETLSGKTLTTPTIASFTNATHNHTNAAGGGQLTDAALSTAVTVAKGGTGATSLTGLLLGNGTSAVTAVTAPSGTVVGTTDTQTLTNKRVNPRVSTTASSATPTPNGDADDMYTVTALAAGATFGAPTGTPVDGQRLVIRVKDNGTARTLAWNAIYRGIGVTLPTTTVISKTLYIGLKYNTADTKWDALAVAQEA
jgi:hypothetical protein